MFEVDQAKRGNSKSLLSLQHDERKAQAARKGGSDDRGGASSGDKRGCRPEAYCGASATKVDCAQTRHEAATVQVGETEAQEKSGGSLPASGSGSAPASKKTIGIDYRDESQYIESTPGNYDAAAEEGLAMSRGKDTRLEDAILDLAPDESAAIATQKRVHHWDKRKKKYINMTLSDLKSSKKLRNESGAVVRVKNCREYEKWQQKHKRSIKRGVLPKRMRARFNLGISLRNMSESTNVRAIPWCYDKSANSKLTSEIKDENTIRKERKEQDKRRAPKREG